MLKTSIWGFEKPVEKYALGTYAKSIKDAKDMLINHMNQLRTDGILETDSKFEQIISDNVSQRSSGSLPPIELVNACKENNMIHAYDYAKRYLQAHGNNAKKALEKVEKSVKIREKYLNQEKISQKDLLEKYIKAVVHPLEDKDGDIIIVIMVGKINMRKITKQIGAENFIAGCLQFLENTIKSSTKELSLCKLTVLADFDGLSSNKHFYRPALPVVMDIFDAIKLCYPEFLKLFICTRCPRIFPILWLLITPFIEEKTKNKIKVHTENDESTLQEIIKIIGLERLPDFLDGPFELNFLNQNMVENFEENINLSQDKSLYQVVTLPEHGSKYSSTILPEPGVLTWDFEVHSEGVVNCLFEITQDDEVKFTQTAVLNSSITGNLTLKSTSKIDLIWTNNSSKSTTVTWFSKIFAQDKFDGSIESLHSALSGSGEATTIDSRVLFSNFSEDTSSGINSTTN